MYSYKPIYQGLPIEETEKVLDRAGQVYDKNLEQSDLIDTVISQMKVPKGGEPYREMVRGKLKNILGTVANDVAGGKRWDLATPQIHQLAKTVTNDQNLTFLQEQRKKIDENEKIATELRAKGQPPIYFGENEDSYQPFDKEGNQVKFKGWYEPKGDWEEQLSKMLSDIKPDEWDELSRSEKFPGYLNDHTKASNVKKINDNIKGIVNNYVVNTATGDQQLRKFMQEGYSRDQAIDQIAKYARNTGERFKVTKDDNNLSVDQIALMQARQSGKVQPNGIDSVFGTDTNEVTADGPKIDASIPPSAFDKNGAMKDNYDVTKATFHPATGGTGDPGTTIQSGAKSTSKEKGIITELRNLYPDFKVNGRRPTDQELYNVYKTGLESYGASARTTASFIDTDVKKAVTNLSNFKGQLDRAEGYVMGNNPKDAKTLREQIKAQKSDFDFGTGMEFEATGVNLVGPTNERDSHAGGIIGTMSDKKGNTVRVVIPMPNEQGKHFSTIANVEKATKEITNFGRGQNDTSRGVGKRVPDTSGLANQYLRNAGINPVDKNGNPIQFAFKPHRFSEEVKPDGSYGSHSGIEQKVRYGLEYYEDGKWKAVVEGDKVHNAIQGINVNGHSAASDWNLEDLRTQTLNSFRNDGIINNALNNQKNKAGYKAEE